MIKFKNANNKIKKAMTSSKEHHQRKNVKQILWQMRSVVAGGSQNTGASQECLKGWSNENKQGIGLGFLENQDAMFSGRRELSLSFSKSFAPPVRNDLPLRALSNKFCI